MASGDLSKIALVHIALGYQLYAVTMGTQYYGGVTDEEDAAIKALLIISMLLYTVVFILICLLNFGDLAGNKPALISVIVIGLIAVLSEVIGLAVFGSVYQDKNIPAFSFTSYIVAAALELIGAILLIVQMCG